MSHVVRERIEVSQHLCAPLHHFFHGFLFRPGDLPVFFQWRSSETSCDVYVAIAQQPFRHQAGGGVRQNVILISLIHTHYHFDVLVFPRPLAWCPRQQPDRFHVSDFHPVHAHRRPSRQARYFRQIGLQPVLGAQEIPSARHIKNTRRQHEETHQHEEANSQFRPRELFSIRHRCFLPRYRETDYSKIRPENA